MTAEGEAVSIRPPCPYDEASCISRFFFHWVRPFLALGSNVEECNLPEVSKDEDFETISDRLCVHWDKELLKPNPSLGRAMWLTFRRTWFNMAVFEIFEQSCKLLQAACIWWLLRYFLLGQEVWRGYLFAVLLVLTFTGSNVAHHHMYFRGWRLGMRIRQTFLGLLFRKSLRLRLSSLGAVSVGAIVNIASNDIERFQQLGGFAVFVFTVPVTVIASLIIGIMVIGPAFAAGYAVLVVLIPLQFLVSRTFGRTRRETAKCSDQRIKLSAQAISGARLMKMQAWELAFLQRIGNLRQTELKGVAKANYARSFNFSLMLSISALMSFLTFVVHERTGGKLRIPDVFMALSLYSVLQGAIFIQFANGMQALVEARVSLQRITAFLTMPEADTRSLCLASDELAPIPSQPLISWQNRSFSYAPPNLETIAAVAAKPTHATPLVNRDSPVVLHHLTFSLMPGELVIVVGPVGAGKTSMLLAMLGELHSHHRERTELELEETQQGMSFGLAPQQPWIFSGTIRENVLLGLPFNEQLYAEVLQACCLQQDIAILHYGDQTRVGDRGVALSGGQRARVGLARLCYAGLMRKGVQARVFLLDDPLSAVDPAVASALFKDVIADAKALLAPFTRVLVTHQLQFLSAKEVSRIVILSNAGHILACDTYERLQGTEVLQQLMAEEEAHPPPASPDGAPVPSSRVPSHASPSLPPASIAPFTSSSSSAAAAAAASSSSSPQLVNRTIAPLTTGSTPHLAYNISVSSPSSPANFQPSFGTPASTTIGHSASSSATTTAFQVEQSAPPSPHTSPTEHDVDLPESQSLSITPFSVLRSNEHDQQMTSSTFPLNNTTTTITVVSLSTILDQSSSPREMIVPESTALLLHDDVSVRDGAASSDPASSASSDTAAVVKSTSVVIQATPHAGEKEDGEKGAISWHTYFQYARAAGVVSTILALTLMTLGQAVAIGTSFWLGKWAAGTYHLTIEVWIGVFGGFTIATVLLGWIRAFYSLRVCITASQQLHDTALTHVFRAPIAFFDMCPLGRILNRFSKDLGTIDDQMPYTVLDFTGCVLTVLGAIVLASVVNPFLLIFFVPLILYFARLRAYYIRSSREVKRLEAASRSPIFSYFAEVLDGLTVIRAFGVQDQFKAQFAARVNANTRAYFQFVATSRWLGFNLDVLTFFLIAFGSVGSVVVHHYGFLQVDGALLGVSLLYLIQLGGLFQWCVRQSAEVENQMVSVERLVSYGQLAPEAALEGPSVKDTEQQGVEISFRHVTCRYRPELIPVLKDVCVSFPSGARCAIVGRTGAGKSSVVEALFRLMESEGDEMCGVFMDGQPTARMGLHPLRRLIGAIPQTPFLFAGTVRDNLDPLGRHSDEMLWAELRNVQMASQIQEAGGLEAEVGEGGGMLSVGERQLLCLARALLQRPKILVLDEATANVDMKTDEMIQRALRTDFRKATVLVIAHRLHTIIDCDLVLVLDDGRVAEVGSPFALLQKYRPAHSTSTGGMPEAPRISFARMVGETGPAMEQMLRHRAQQAYQSSNNSVEV